MSQAPARAAFPWQVAPEAACAAALALAATDRAGPLAFGLVWGACVALFARPVSGASPALAPSTTRHALGRALRLALVAGAVTAAGMLMWGLGAGWLERRLVFGPLSGPQTLLWAALCAAGAAPAAVAGVDAWARRPSRPRAVVAGLGVTLALAGWFAAALAQVGYLEALGGELEAGWRAALHALTPFTSAPAASLYGGLALAVPFGLVVVCHGFGLRRGRATAALVVATAAWSGLLHGLAQAWHLGRGDVAVGLPLLAPPLVLAAALLRWLEARVSPAAPPP